MTRAEVAVEIIGRVGAWFALVGKSAVTDGTNPDLNSPIRRALAALKITVADPAHVTDAEIGQVPAAKVEEFFNLVEFFALDGLTGSITGSVSQLGPRREDQTKIVAPLTARLKRLSDLTKDDRPDAPVEAGEFKRTIFPYAPVAVHAVWRAGAGQMPAQAATPIIPTPTPDDDQDIVIDVDDKVDAAFDKVYAADATAKAVGVTLPAITKPNDGKRVTINLVKAAGGNGVVVRCQTGNTIIGIIADAPVDAATATFGGVGDTLLLIVDADNARWLAQHTSTGGKRGGRVIKRRITTVSNVPFVIQHDWGTLDVDATIRDAATRALVRLHVQPQDQLVEITSAADQEYDVILEEIV